MAKSTSRKPQIDKFKAAALEAECDTDEAKFDQVLGQLAKSPEPPKSGKSKVKRSNKKPV